MLGRRIKRERERERERRDNVMSSSEVKSPGGKKRNAVKSWGYF